MTDNQSPVVIDIDWMITGAIHEMDDVERGNTLVQLSLPMSQIVTQMIMGGLGRVLFKQMINPGISPEQVNHLRQQVLVLASAFEILNAHGTAYKNDSWQLQFGVKAEDGDLATASTVESES